MALRDASDPSMSPAEVVTHFVEKRPQQLARATDTIVELERDPATLDAVAVAIRALRDAVER